MINMIYLRQIAVKHAGYIGAIIVGTLIYVGFEMLGIGQSSSFDIEFTSIMPFDFQYGYPHQCHVKATLRNNTKYRFEHVTFKISDWDVNASANANTESKDVNVLDVSTGNDLDCAEGVRFIKDNIKSVEIFDCSIPGVAEGDCQKLIRVSTKLNVASTALIKLLQVGGHEKQMGALQKALKDASLDNADFAPYDKKLYFKYRDIMNIIASAVTKSSYSLEYIPNSIGDIRLIRQTDALIELQGTATVQTIFTKTKFSQIYIVRIPKEGIPCTVASQNSGCKEIPVPRLMELTDAYEGMAVAGEGKSQEEPRIEDPHDRRAEVEKISGPYKEVAGSFIREIKAEGLCGGSGNNSFKCSNEWDKATDPIDIYAHFDNKEFSLSLMSQIKNGGSGIYADVQLRNKSGIDLSSNDIDASGAFKNVVFPLLNAFHVNSEAGIDAIKRCQAKSEPEPAQKNWVTTEVNGTRVQCLFYGPNFRNFGPLHLARIILFREVH